MFLAPREPDSTTDRPTSMDTHLPAPPKPRRGPWLQILSPHGFEWNRYELPINGLPQPLHGLRIVHLSDLHLLAYWTTAYDQLLDRLHDNPPDLLLITGDLIEEKRSQLPAIPIVRRLVSQLTARYGVFAISGNHDGDLLAPHLADLNLTFLDGHSATIRLPHDPPPPREGPGDGEPPTAQSHPRSPLPPLHPSAFILHPSRPSPAIELIGLPGPYREDFVDLHTDFLGRLPRPTPGVPRIVLSHYPDLIHHLTPLQPDIVLTGHTHGGQICLPGGRAVITHDTLPRHRCKGIHRIGRTHLVINRGFGFATIPVRLFCPAEVMELILTP